MSELKIKALPAFSDNYIWLLYRPNSSSADPQKAWVVDPGDAAPVLAALKQYQLQLEGVLLTHHHGDHDGGIPALKEAVPTLRVVCGINSDSLHGNEAFSEDQIIEVLGCEWKIINIPGHTLDHIAFYCAEQQALFCGDTLFAGGCGRLFEGTPEQMYQSLQRLAGLPAQTRVFCAHEYTQANLLFAQAVEPGNLKLQQRIKAVNAARLNNQATIPSLLASELETNPFLRCQQAAVIEAAIVQASLEPRYQAGISQMQNAESAVFTTLRAWKNDF